MCWSVRCWCPRSHEIVPTPRNPIFERDKEKKKKTNRNKNRCLRFVMYFSSVYICSDAKENIKFLLRINLMMAARRPQLISSGCMLSSVPNIYNERREWSRRNEQTKRSKQRKKHEMKCKRAQFGAVNIYEWQPRIHVDQLPDNIDEYTFVFSTYSVATRTHIFEW